MDGHDAKGEMALYVRSMDGGRARLVVKPLATISDVKRLVHEELGYPIEHQRLVKSSGSRCEDDEASLSYCDISDGDVMYLALYAMRVNFSRKDFRTGFVERSDCLLIEPGETVLSMKFRLCELWGDPVENQRSAVHAGKS